jgi:hypothetical protein
MKTNHRDGNLLIAAVAVLVGGMFVLAFIEGLRSTFKALLLAHPKLELTMLALGLLDGLAVVFCLLFIFMKHVDEKT